MVLLLVDALFYAVFANPASDDLPNNWLRLYALIIVALAAFFYWVGKRLTRNLISN